MEAKPAPGVYDGNEPWEVAAAYRVTLWEQRARRPDADPPRTGRSRSFGVAPGATRMGWEETAFELVGVQDVREAIRWAEEALASGKGSASRRGHLVQDREYVIYARGPNEDRWLQVAGWTPVLSPAEPPFNLRRLRELS